MKLISFISFLLSFTIYCFTICHSCENIPYQQEKSSHRSLNSSHSSNYNNISDYRTQNLIDSIKAQNRHRYKLYSPNSTHYCATQFKNHFTQLGYSEEEILNQHMLHKNNEFIQFAKTLPGYEQYITSLYKKLKKITRFQKFIRLIQGLHYPGFTKRINDLYEEIEKTKTSRYKPHCRQQIIEALNTSSNQLTAATKIDTIVKISLHKQSYIIYQCTPILKNV